MALESKILVGQADNRGRTATPDVAYSWRWIGWFSLVLTIAALGDWLLAWIPLHLGSPEWEFGTVVASFSGLPLATMGFAGLLASSVARGIRWQMRAVSAAVLLWTAFILGALVLFLLDVPVALGAVEGPARLGIVKAIIKTIMLGSLFSATYIIAAVGALRRAART